MLETRRLILLPSTPQLLKADIQGPQALVNEIAKTVTGTQLGQGWPTEHYDADAARWVLTALEQSNEPDWWMHYFLLKDNGAGTPLLAGVGGYKGPPNEEGKVEIGYSIVDSLQRQGLATEAAHALIAHAFQDTRVQYVTAETLPTLIASMGVMEKCGLQLEGEGSEPGVVRFKLDREAYDRR